jgi:aspartate aminotransferase
LPLRIASRAANLAPSATLEIDALAKSLAARGEDLVAFGAGEPDFDTPTPIADAAVTAIRGGKTRYTLASGIPELRAAIAEDLGRRHGVAYAPDQIVVGNGAKHAIHDAFQVLIDPGDEVLLPSPYWVSYAEMVRLSGGVPVVVPSDGSCRPHLERLAAACTPRTRGIVINTPNNPTGAVYTRAELSGIFEIARAKDLWILSDEVYERITRPDVRHVSPASLGGDAPERVVIASSVSKTFAMTGWRIGYLAAPTAVANAAAVLQSQTTSNPNTPAQWASVAALRGDSRLFQGMIDEYDRRRRRIEEAIATTLRLECPPLQGTFFAFPRVEPLFGRSFEGEVVKDSASLSSLLLKKAKVVTVPGSAFGAEGHIRLSYATSLDRIDEGMRRIKTFLIALR